MSKFLGAAFAQMFAIACGGILLAMIFSPVIVLAGAVMRSVL